MTRGWEVRLNKTNLTHGSEEKAKPERHPRISAPKSPSPINHGTGFTGFGAVGYGFGNGLRIEGEGVYNFSHDNYTDYANLNNSPYLPISDAPKYIPGITVTKENCNTLLGQSEESYLGSAYSTNASGWLVPTWSNVQAGHYIMPGVCYNLTASSIKASNAAVQTLYTNKYFANNIPSAIYVNSTKFPAEYNGHKFSSLAQNITPPFTPVNHRGTDESYGGFFNVIYDFDLERLFGIKSIVTPFVGGGAGYLWQRYNRPNIIPGAITGTHGGFILHVE